jgi:hypothetical protein
VTFHGRPLEGEEPFEVRVRNAIVTDIENKCNELILKSTGKEVQSGDGYKVLEIYSPHTKSYTFGVTNETGNVIEVTLDLSSSENLTYSSKSALVKKTI